MLYLDTSVLVAFYIPEPKSDKVQKFLASAGKVAISPLIEVEFHSAISRRVRMKEISREAGQQVISQFQLHVRGHVFYMQSLMQREYELARDWIGKFQTPLRTLDALHLAVAFSNKLELVTNDSLFTKSAQKLGIKVTRI